MENLNESAGKKAFALPGMAALIGITILLLGGLSLFLMEISSWFVRGPIVFLLALFTFLIFPILYAGLKIVKPNEAYVFTLFGKYYGNLRGPGFYWVNPFCSAVNPTATGKAGARTLKQKPEGVEIGGRKVVSLKAITLSNEKQKINDELGNPIEIGIVVVWRVVEEAKAVFNVENYEEFLSMQSDSALRNIVRSYPYDTVEGSGEQSLRGSSQEISDKIKEAKQEKVEIAGLEIKEARITHLAYAPEIAAAMLQRQQAAAIIDARSKIVEGAVGMVQMALTKLSEDGVVDLDEERKAAMVSNLLVVLCSNKDTQPVVNSGSIY